MRIDKKYMILSFILTTFSIFFDKLDYLNERTVTWGLPINFMMCFGYNIPENGFSAIFTKNSLYSISFNPLGYFAGIIACYMIILIFCNSKLSTFSNHNIRR